MGNPFGTFSSKKTSPKIDKYEMSANPQGSYGLEEGNTSENLSSKTTPSKNIQGKTHQEKDRKILGPQVRHRLERGDLLKEILQTSSTQRKTRGYQGKYGIRVGPQDIYSWKGGSPWNFHQNKPPTQVRQGWDVYWSPGNLRPKRGITFENNSRKTTHPKKIQSTLPHEKDSKSLFPQSSHCLEGGDPLEISIKPAPFKKQKKGIKGKDGIHVVPQFRYSLEGGSPLEENP